ncbi:ATP-binding protein [Martelella sp. FLE1502]
MLKNPTPFTFLVLAALCGLVMAAVTLLAAIDRPWLGVTFSAEDWSAVVRIDSTISSGPARMLPPGAAVATIGDMMPEPGDLVEEPDVAESYKALSRFFERQSLLNRIIGRELVAITTAEPEASQVLVEPAAHRPLTSLPGVFWVQLVTGLATLVIGAWVWSLRRHDAAAWLLAVAGLSIPVSAFPAAIYSSRELALPGGLFRALTAINHFGTLLFGVAMLALFLIYPRRLVSNRVLWLLPIVVGGVWILDTLQVVFRGPVEALHVPVVILMAAIIISAVAQYFFSRRDPAARAAIRWFALSVGLCAGTFVSVIILPNLFGVRPSISQGYAFVLFGLLFVGVAVGVARHRLFELEGWAFSILSYFGAFVLLLLLDAALISFMAMDRSGAFAVSLLVVALVYLPFRNWMARRLMPRGELDRETLFGRIVDVALAKDAVQEERWRQILSEAFQPLHLSDGIAGEADEPAIEEDGLALAIPRIVGLAPVRLSYAYRGRRLFSPRDRRFAADICAMLAHAIASRDAREKGAREERMRIARDMHDNMGAQLLSALHSETNERKNTLIRETIADLRDIVNNAARGGKTLEEVLADLRIEALERLAAADIALDWRDSNKDGDTMLAPNIAYALRSILREIVSNAIRHSGASSIRLRFSTENGIALLDVSDNGSGLSPGCETNGNGLANLEARVTALHGTLVMGDARPGLVVRARFPLSESRAT